MHDDAPRTELERRGETESGQEQRLTGLAPPSTPTITPTLHNKSHQPLLQLNRCQILYMAAVQNNYELIYT